MRFALAFLLLVLSLALYSSVTGHPFSNYDDPSYVTENAHVRAGLTWSTLAWALTSTEASNWHPLTWVSHALDSEVFGMNASGHHWTSVWFHALNAVFLFLLLEQATGDMCRSCVVAAVFAVHPLNVESVAWIAERKNVLSTFLFLLALMAYGWYALRPGLKRYSIVASLFALGLMAKPMLVTLPFVLLLIDYWPLQRIAGGRALPPTRFRRETWPRLVLEKLPLVALASGSAVLTVIAQQSSLAPIERFPLPLRIENALTSCVIYLAKAFWPTGLALYYPHPAALPVWQWAGAALVLVAVSVLVWQQASARPYRLMGWSWFLVTLVPVMGLVQVGAQARADRYTYLPLIGIFFAVVWTVRMPLPTVAQSAIAACVLLALATVTWRQVGYWKTNVALWSQTLAVTQGNLVAEDKLGAALQAMGRQEEAVIHFANASRIDPADPFSNFSLGADLQWHGRLREAIPFYATSIQYSTDARLRADAYQNLATDYAQLGDAGRARENFLRALKANPALVTVFAGLGDLAGEPARTLSQNVLQTPTDEGYLQVARVFQKDGLVPEARLAYSQALTMNPALVDAKRELAALPPDR